ncbi:ATP synthase subunit f, mitochondrial [Merluccius polli]|uniref:ATP synthase subunit f, mitochondrial n=1 Tax=Merluccius polli TaxID=89951 RepID=A0AA47P990_MERPO|nr:ATP synthase subunit f, mitochondrial [Merluccius polli]
MVHCATSDEDEDEDEDKCVCEVDEEEEEEGKKEEEEDKEEEEEEDKEWKYLMPGLAIGSTGSFPGGPVNNGAGQGWIGPVPVGRRSGVCYDPPSVVVPVVGQSRRSLLIISYSEYVTPSVHTRVKMADRPVPVIEKRLMDVKLGEMGSWLGGRDFTPNGLLSGLRKGYDGYYSKYINVKRGGIGGVAMLVTGYVVLSYVWNYEHLSKDCIHSSMIAGGSTTKPIRGLTLIDPQPPCSSSNNITCSCLSSVLTVHPGEGQGLCAQLLLHGDLQVKLDVVHGGQQVLHVGYARHGEPASEGLHLSLDLSHALLELHLLGQGFLELLQRSFGVQAALDLHEEHQTLPLWRNSATFLKSSSTRPLEVRAGEPNLRPLGRRALLSPGSTKPNI